MVMRTECVGGLALAALLLGQEARAASFEECVVGIRGSAMQRGVSRATFDRVMTGVTPDPTVIEAMR